MPHKQTDPTKKAKTSRSKYDLTKVSVKTSAKLTTKKKQKAILKSAKHIAIMSTECLPNDAIVDEYETDDNFGEVLPSCNWQPEIGMGELYL